MKVTWTEHSAVDTALYEALVAKAREKMQPESEQVKEQYTAAASKELMSSHGLTKEQAENAITARMNGTLLPGDIITFQGGEVATVEQILADPAKYDRRPCADPNEPEEGTSRAMFFANSDTKNPVIHSFLHGKQIYHLSTGSIEDDFQMVDDKPTVPFEELQGLADILEPGDLEGIRELLELSAGVDDLEMQELLVNIKKSTGMTMGAMQSHVERSKDSGAKDLDHLDLAKKLIDQIGKQNILSVENGVFMWQPRGVWKMVENGDLQQKVQRIIEQEVDVVSSLVDGVTKVFTNEIYRSNHQFNVGDPEVINCRNGELHLSKKQGRWELKAHDREAYRTSQIPVDYDPLADAPRFKEFVKEIFANDIDASGKAKALLEMIGYTMVAHCRYELFIILIGAGANGKSVLLSVLEALVGSENTVGVQPSQFDNRFQRAHLRHKLANIVTEVRQGEVIADAELKGIVSGEPSTVENKFKDPFTMRPYATCWFATNHMPHTRDFSEALFRRALIIKFNRVFTDKEKNPRLKDELIFELPGILNLALDAYAKAVCSNFTRPESSENAKEEWRLEADQVQQFVLECCVKAPYEEAMVPAARLYAGYRWWANENGIQKTLTQKSFRDRLNRLGFGSKRTKQGSHVTGLEVGEDFHSHCL